MADASVSPIDLAHEPDFSVGPLLVRPSLRAAVHEGVEQQLEPRVMQVLVALVRRAGEVVSRDDLVTLCWGGRAIGEDAINRPVAQLRKLAEDTGAFSIETITRVGYRLTAKGEVAHTQPSGAQTPKAQGAAQQPQPSKRTVILAAALGLLVLVAAGLGITLAGRPALEPSIAVLPFENLGGDPSKDYLARGVSMKIIDTLAQIKGIEVISRNSSFSFPANAIPTEVGTRLNVAHVLSGTVRDQDGRLTITADLINARTGKTIRSEEYVADTAATRISGVQNYMAEKIAGAMSIAFRVEQRPDGSGTDSLEAYDLYLRGLYAWWIEGNTPASIDYYTKATDIDPDYAEPWAGLAIAIASTGFSFANPADARARQNTAYEHAQRAVRLGPAINIVQTYYGAVTTTQLKWIEGDDAFQKALAISRSEQALLNWFFLLQRTGRLAEVARAMTELEQIDPVRGLNALAVHAYASQGRYDELKADLTRRNWFMSTDLVPLINVMSYHINTGGSRADIRAALEGISRRPEQAPAELASRILAVMGNPEKARTVLREAYADPKLDHATRWEMVPYLAAWLGDDELVVRLWRDELPVNMLRTLYMWDPAFARARKLPEFKVLMRELHLPEYWRAKGWADRCQPVGVDDFECT